MSGQLPATTKLPKMSPLEKEVLEIFGDLNPVELYGLGLRKFRGKLFILSKPNIKRMRARIEAAKNKCKRSDEVVRKFLDSIEATLLWDEPGAGIAQVTNAISGYLIKEGIVSDHLKELLDRAYKSLEAWNVFLDQRTYPVAIRILAQYQVLGAFEVIDLIESQSTDPQLTEITRSLRTAIERIRQKFSVIGFTDGDFEEVVKILAQQGPDLERESFYPYALKKAFDYNESYSALERKALRWLDEELPKFKAYTKTLAIRFGCENNPETVQEVLRGRPGMDGKLALQTTNRLRPTIQALVSESIAGINSRYNAKVMETPSYLTSIIPTAAAQGYDGLTNNPRQLYFLTTDPKRAPPGGLADLIDTLVHEEYGHCLHFSNTASEYAARATITEILPSLHTGTTSEGLAFQREMEFLELIEKLSRKRSSSYTEPERAFVNMISEYERFDEFLIEMEFAVYRFRIVRFLRVIGDTRINSGKQNLLDFLDWAKRKTKLAPRTVFYQIFLHEGIFPGYATCYAVVGQEIRALQKRLKNDPRKLAMFNAYATSMGYPSRSIYLKRLKIYSIRLAKMR